MPYEFSEMLSEQDCRIIFENVYCNKDNPIITFDDIAVEFYSDDFRHAFYESNNWKKKDKSVFSVERAKRIMWIKEALQDKSADLRKGWDKKLQSYDNTTRVAIVVGKYVVIIKLIKPNKAKFITAFWADNSITNILESPKWKD